MKTQKDYRKIKKCKCNALIWKESKQCKACANKGKLNPAYIDGRTSKFHNCKTCKKQISRQGDRCHSCTKILFHSITSFKGINNPNWKGGFSPELYPKQFNKILKEFIRRRDNHTCQVCSKKGKHVHHIDYNKNNCSEDNLITLCKSCHSKTNGNRAIWYNFFINKQYLKYKKPIIIFTTGVWDLIHIGHINIFKIAKQLGNYLIVGVSTNKLIKSYKKINPILNCKQRKEVIKAIKYVDKVVTQTELIDIQQFKDLNADLFLIGDDWKDRKDIKGLNWLRKHNLVKFVPYTKELSTTKIKNKIVKEWKLT